mgnify:CR=1 FL=1
MLRGKVFVMMDDMIDTAGKLSHLSYRKHNSKIDHLIEGQLGHDLIQLDDPLRQWRKGRV